MVNRLSKFYFYIIAADKGLTAYRSCIDACIYIVPGPGIVGGHRPTIYGHTLSKK